MNTLLRLASWLEAQYALHLNVKLERDFAGEPVALWTLEGEAEREVGSLLDVDLGVWFKFIVVDRPNSVQERVDSEVMAALNDSSQLLWKSGLPEGTADKNGAWTVTLVFLVRNHCQPAWDRAIQKLRAQSGFTEEIAIDAIFYEDEIDLSEKLNLGAALPHLLFQTRKLLQLPINELDTWNSADSEVAKLMEVLQDRFTDPEDQRLAKTMVTQVRKAESGLTRPSSITAPLRVGTLSIANTRNISDFELPLGHPDHDVLAQIIYGPNGTGKSSIFEALSFAVAQSSRRMSDYIVDKDENSASPAASKYIENVLRPLDSNSQPDVRIDGVSVFSALPNDRSDAESRLTAADGTLLAQEDATMFVRMPGEVLGAKVLGGYSQLAQSLQRRCDDEYRSANVQRQNWLRTFNIDVKVRKDDSRLLNLALHFLQAQFPYGSQQILSWLLAVDRMVSKSRVEARNLNAAWKAVDELARREKLAKDLLPWHSLGETTECSRLLEKWISERQNVLHAIATLRAGLADTSSELVSQRADIEADLKDWQVWLLNQGASAPTYSPQDDQTAKDLGFKLEVLKAEGSLLAERLQHVKQVQVTLIPSWTQHHPDVCPTCDANRQADGGIRAVLESLATDLTDRVEKARRQYSGLLTQLREVNQRRAAQGQCPISDDRRSYLARLLGMDDDGYQTLNMRLKESGSVADIMRSVDALVAPPPLPLQEDADKAADRVWNMIETENSRGIALWDLPERWLRIQGVVRKECVAIVDRHLPKTLQAVWTELTMAMTPARWNLSGLPTMLPANNRSGNSLKVVVGEGTRRIGVRHIFNQAEAHVLGLAWFFTRYLSYGRARHALIALDDPAQEMDQTTFRSFTRFLQTLCRLHERYKLPLTLVLLLHQEDRALDAARATSHRLITLKWAKRISSATSVEQVILMAPGFDAPLPKKLRRSPSSSATQVTV